MKPLALFVAILEQLNVESALADRSPDRIITDFIDGLAAEARIQLLSECQDFIAAAPEIKRFIVQNISEADAGLRGIEQYSPNEPNIKEILALGIANRIIEHINRS
jgi:hypothetical protein